MRVDLKGVRLEVPAASAACRVIGVVPDQIEFWQGRNNRLHDRFEYSKMPDGTWKIERLAP